MSCLTIPPLPIALPVDIPDCCLASTTTPPPTTTTPPPPITGVIGLEVSDNPTYSDGGAANPIGFVTTVVGGAEAGNYYFNVPNTNCPNPDSEPSFLLAQNWTGNGATIYFDMFGAMSAGATSISVQAYAGRSLCFQVGDPWTSYTRAFVSLNADPVSYVNGPSASVTAILIPDCDSPQLCPNTDGQELTTLTITVATGAVAFS